MAPRPEAVATVAGSTITAETLQAEVRRRSGPDGSGVVPLERKLAALDRLVDQEAVYARAKAEHFDETPEMQRLIRQVVTSHFKEQRLPAAREVVEAREIEAYYQAHPERYALPEAVRGAVILVRIPYPAPPEEIAEVRGKAEQILRSARAASDAAAFAALVVNHSEHQASRYRGGELGWLGREGGAVDAAVAEALFAVSKPGEFAPLVETPQGFYVAKLLEKRPAGVKPLETVRASIRQELVREKSERAERAFFDSVRSGLEIRVYRDRVDALAVSPSASPHESSKPSPFSPVRPTRNPSLRAERSGHGS